MLKKYARAVVLSLSIFAGSLQASVFYKPIMAGDFKKIKELLSSGTVKIDEADVALAALKGHVEIVALFLAKGAPLDSGVMSSAVRGACANKKMDKAYEEIVQMLLKARAPFDKDAISMAMKCGHLNIAEMLLDAMPNFSGQTLSRLRSI